MDGPNYLSHVTYLAPNQPDEALRKSRLAELHPHRQVIAVLGLLHCPSVSPQGMAAAHAEFRNTAWFPEARVTRCFALEPSEGHILQDSKAHIDGLVMFPPGGAKGYESPLKLYSAHKISEEFMGRVLCG